MQAGETLGDYKILELIGKGGQGVVYKALDLKLKRFVAIKIFAASDMHRGKKLASFKYEARLASTLNHPNICTVYGLFEDESHTYIVMEYVDGKNLYQLAHARPLEVKSALEIMIQVTNGLTAAHARHIIHRDIKPRNVMVTKSGRAVVLDFGLAKLLENVDDSFNPVVDAVVVGIDTPFDEELPESLFITVEGKPYGTPTSSPPEMALGLQTDARGDIFSVGVLLYLLLTGKYPFLGNTISEVRDKIVNQEPVPVSVAREVEGVIPLELIAVVSHALRKKPEERFQTMAELRDRLVAIRRETENGEAGSAPFRGEVLQTVRTPPRHAAPQPWKIRRQTAIIFSAIGALILMILTLKFFF